MEAVAIILTMWCVLTLVLMLHSLRTIDRKAAERAERSHRATLDALARAGLCAAPSPRAPRTGVAYPGRGLQRLPVLALPLDTRARETLAGAIVDVEFSAAEHFDSTAGRWLAQVMGASRGANERSDDDTPAPHAQRLPVLPPLSR